MMQIQCFPSATIAQIERIAKRNELSVHVLLHSDELLSKIVWKQLKIFELNPSMEHLRTDGDLCATVAREDVIVLGR